MEPTETTQQQPSWPNHWGEDPFTARGYSPKAERWWEDPVHKQVRMAKSASEWEHLWGTDAKWEDPKEGYSEALSALRAVQYKISQGSEEHIKSLTRALTTGVVPAAPLDLWKERWMREKFVEGLMAGREGTPLGGLASAVLTHWPWAIVWTGQSKQDYQHPLARAVRAGNEALASRLFNEIKPEDWLDWTGSSRDTYFNLRGIWRDRHHWFAQDSSWIKQVVEHDPRLLAPHPMTGLGPLEQAARDNLPEMLRQLLEHGWTPEPEKSFGLTLSHWAINGLSEEKWNSRSATKEPKTAAEIEDSAERCGQTLSVLQEFGYGMHDPVIKATKIDGVRRPVLPKPKTTAAEMLVVMREKEKLRPETLAMLEQANLLASTPKSAPPVAGRRARL
jgi:hypothetical protein